jgi:hypothetical protein
MSCSGENYREYVKRELIAACRKIIDNADGIICKMNMMSDFSVNIDIQCNEATEITIQSSHLSRDYSEDKDGSYKFEVNYKSEGKPLKENEPEFLEKTLRVPEQNLHGITKADWGDI